MNRLLIKNIRTLAGIVPTDTLLLRGEQMGSAEQIDGAWLLAEDGVIVGFGPMETCPEVADEVVDAVGRVVFPAFCDSHSHIVYAGSREGEFRDKIAGMTYQEVAARGGGILNSADRLHEASEEELFEAAYHRAWRMIRTGAATLEIKSGYGLTTEDELKMLRVVARLQRELPATVKATFLGAHAVGRAFAGRQSDYVDHVCEQMLPAVSEQGVAEFVDVFCDSGFFTPEETARILECGARYGLRPKIHANELASSGGVQVGIRYGALSVDHLEEANEQDVADLAASATIPTVLPGASFFSNLPFAPARKMIDAGLPVAIASDCNPGSSPSGNMVFLWSLACIKMRLTPEEALSALTINGAAALGLSADRGAISVGRRADLVISKPVPSLAYIPYSFGEELVESVIINGKMV
ncbi:MAG: imidazolonepropionase [Tidjanibacter sp.]|nr:imidazolonepropionase [Tidjanibacter sp.]MBR7129454.1 imidazolonepropionase [Tidjanibacter sp.]